VTSRTQGPTGAVPGSRSPAGLARFNVLPADEATAALRTVCTSAAWAAALLARRPYPTAAHLVATSDAATAALTDADLAQALAGHPPIGHPTPGDARSAREQRGMAGAPEQLNQEMAELNLAYQRTFGHVFLICATGLTGAQLRDALRSRLGNPPERERDLVRAELAKINKIRLLRLVEEATG
jgi:2-oxo-4-hydroxy-4-carboxy-5-ureidoimidazoline decarboxylase